MAGARPNKVRTSDLVSRIAHVAQNNCYLVRLQPPEPVRKFINKSGRGLDYFKDGLDIELSCAAASLPGSSFATHNIDNDYMGSSETSPYRRMYDSTTDFTFYVGRQYNVVEMFDGWLDFISGMGSELEGSRDSFDSPYANTRFSYPIDYKTNIFITKFEKDATGQLFEVDEQLLTDTNSILTGDGTRKPYLEYTFVNAYPLNIIQSPVSYGPADLLRYTVSMSYMRYTRRRKFSDVERVLGTV